jgi:hypothetical protein
MRDELSPEMVLAASELATATRKFLKSQAAHIFGIRFGTVDESTDRPLFREMKITAMEDVISQLSAEIRQMRAEDEILP